MSLAYAGDPEYPIHPTRKKKATDVQVGGTHYKDCGVQPINFIMSNKMPFADGNAIKYIARHRKKNGREDLEKAIHYIKFIIEDEYPDD